MRYTYLDLIEEVGEIWEVAEEKGYSKKLMSIGKTPVNTMNACIRKHIEKSKNVKFKQTSKNPALYYLNN